MTLSRELYAQILVLMAEGLTDAEIAARLHLSTKTVSEYARNIYGELGARNRAHAVHRAHVTGIFTRISAGKQS